MENEILVESIRDKIKDNYVIDGYDENGELIWVKQPNCNCHREINREELD